MAKIPILAHISSATFLIPSIAGMLRFKKLDTAVKVFVLFSIVVCIDVIAELILTLNKINNSYLSNIFVLFEVETISCIYFFAVKDGIKRKIIILCALIFIFIWGIDKVLFELPGQINRSMAILSRIVIILNSTLTMQWVHLNSTSRLNRDPVFWIAGGQILYSAGVLFIVGLSEELILLGRDYFIAAWSINWGLIIIANLMYTRGIFCSPTD